jgi:cytochrome b6-f complex iron-sulfur subunit
MNTQMPSKKIKNDYTDNSRRAFLEKIGKFSFFAGFAGIFTSTMRFLLPNVLYEPPTTFNVGNVEDFPPDSTTFLEENRLFIFNKPEGIFAVSSICSHLGCNVKWNDNGNGFDCPCHGSTFDKNGKNISGPAPKPLKWYQLTLDSKKMLTVHTSKEVDKNFRLIV